MNVDSKPGLKMLARPIVETRRVKLPKLSSGVPAEASSKAPLDVIAGAQGGVDVATPQPATQGLRDPGKPIVTARQKAVDWSPLQRAQLIRGLAKLSSARANALLQRLLLKDGSLRQPSVFEFAGANGTQERWLIGATARAGSFGKFRVAIDLNRPDSEAMAVKEYRLEAREPKEAAQTTLSASKVARAQAMLRKIGLENPSLRSSTRMFIRALSIITDPGMLPVYQRDMKLFIKSIGSSKCKDAGTLLLRKRTQHIKPEAVAEENKLYPLAASPLEVKHSVELDDRIYNFSGLMAGEAYDVAVGDLGAHRKPLSRMLSLDALQSLATLHDQGILHRDIKPENLFLNRQATAHLGDWGFAFQPTPQDPATRSLGTPAYIAPEVLAREPYGTAMDIYSMGHTICALSLSEVLIANWDPIKHQGKLANKPQLALDHIVRSLPFAGDGTLDHQALVELRTILWKAPRLDLGLTPKIVDDMICQIIAWHEKDPQVCEIVTKHMVQFDPRNRASVHELIERFSALQPTDAATRASAKAVALERMQGEMSVEDEIEILKVYGKVDSAASRASRSRNLTRG